MANALPGEDGEVDLVVDGNVHQSLDGRVAVPVEAPAPVPTVENGVAVHVRTYELVLPNPVGPAYRAAAGQVPARLLPVTMDDEGFHSGAAGRTVYVPWYYMMDEESIRPWHVLFWDTGTSWYYDYADDAYASYTGGPATPADQVKGVAPGVRVRTFVNDIDFAAKVGVLLDGVARGTTLPLFERPDAPFDAGAAALALPGAANAALAQGAGLAARPYVVPADPGALASGDAGFPAQAVAERAIALPTALAAAAAGVAGVLVGFALYHLIRKSAILKNKVRSSIAEHVLHHPGSTITEIAQAVGVTHQTASYHLRLLQEHGLVIGVERGNKRLYFRNDGSFNQEERGLVAVLRDPESMRVLELIRSNPWIMKNEAAAALGVSRNTLNWHLQKLLGAGLVSEARENGHCFLFCNRRSSGELLTTVAQKVEDRKASEVPQHGAPPPTNGNGLHPAPTFPAQREPMGS